MTIRGVTLWDLIRHVYTRPSPHYFDGRPTPYRVEGGAKWVETDRFDIDATMPPGASKDSYRAMLRTLLRDRFKLDAAIVAKDMPASLLVVRDAAKGLGPRLRRSTSECSSVNIVMVAPGQRGMARACELVLESQLAGGTFAVHGRGAGLGLLARYLSQQHGLVVDQTQLTGVFDFDFECCASWMEEPYTVPLSVYLEEQLGLTLRSTKAPEEVVVIRKAERPR
jgi:uncharacterized protein (TIGR03435 family)